MKNREGRAILLKDFKVEKNIEKTSKKLQKSLDKLLHLWYDGCTSAERSFFVRPFLEKSEGGQRKKLRLREVFGSMVSVMHDASNKLGGAEQ